MPTSERERKLHARFQPISPSLRILTFFGSRQCLSVVGLSSSLAYGSHLCISCAFLPPLKTNALTIHVVCCVCLILQGVQAFYTSRLPELNKSTELRATCDTVVLLRLWSRLHDVELSVRCSVDRSFGSFFYRLAYLLLPAMAPASCKVPVFTMPTPRFLVWTFKDCRNGPERNATGQ